MFKFNQYIPSGYASWTDYYRQRKTISLVKPVLATLFLVLMFALDGKIDILMGLA